MALIHVADATFMVGRELRRCGGPAFTLSPRWFLGRRPSRSQLVPLRRSKENLRLHTVGLDGVRFQVLLLQGPSSRQKEEEHHHKIQFCAELREGQPLPCYIGPISGPKAGSIKATSTP